MPHSPSRPAAAPAPLGRLVVLVVAVLLAQPGLAAPAPTQDPPAAAAGEVHVHDPPRAEHLDHGPAAWQGALPLEIGLVLDALLDRSDGAGASDGVAADVRTLSLTLGSEVDEATRLDATIVVREEEVELEEAAATFGDRANLRAGRFFIDFGRQMRRHVHDLPTPERPGVLAAYLGEEAPGTGVQVARRWSASERASLRASLGVFTALETHGHEEDEGGPEAALAERLDADELALTARLAWREARADGGRLELGASARHQPDFAFADEGSGFTAEGLANTVWGLDASWDAGAWSLGAEYLAARGDLAAEVGGAGLDVFDGDVDGFYVWGERRLGGREHAGHDHGAHGPGDALGLLVGRFEHPEAGAPSESELTAYYTRALSPAARLRVAATQRDSDEEGDSTRLLVQLTIFGGAHAHGPLD